MTTFEVVCYLGIVVIGVLAVAGMALAVLALPFFFVIAACMRRR